jgi:hypothetical protein
MTQEPRPSTNLSDELTRLVNQVTEAARLAWESEECKRLQTEISEGVKNFSVQVDEAVRRASESETAKKVRTQAEQVAVRARETDVVDDMRQGLLVGLQTLNRELGKLLERLHSSGAPVSTGPVPPQAPAAPSETMTSPAINEPPSDPSVEI